MEIDFYVGYSTELPMGVGVDVGHTWYEYPGNEAGNDPNAAVANDTREFHIGFSYSILSYKYSRASTTWFGIPGSKGSDYHSIGVEFSPSEKLTLSASAGNQKVKRAVGQGENSFKDYSVGGSYEVGDGYSLGLSYHRVSFKDSAAKEGWFVPLAPNAGAGIFKSGVVVSLSKTF